jgi:hypothetical protein
LSAKVIVEEVLVVRVREKTGDDLQAVGVKVGPGRTGWR